MPLYEYVCESCEHHFETMQSLSAKAEDTTCPKCQMAKSRRIMSACASKIVGTQKPGFAEQKAYSMLNERMDKFSKLPPIMGQREAPTETNSQPSAGE
ncbi:MAG: zinc ribbon domain-containing protein [Nitrospirales bacterium]